MTQTISKMHKQTIAYAISRQTSHIALRPQTLLPDAIIPDTNYTTKLTQKTLSISSKPFILRRNPTAEWADFFPILKGAYNETH
jgi:hypothetical protein